MNAFLDVIAWMAMFFASAMLLLDAALWMWPPKRKRLAKREHMAPLWYGFSHARHSINLFELHRWEREHPATIIHTDRYRTWIAKRDAI